MTPLWTTFVSQNEGILFRRITYDAVNLGWAKEMLVKYNLDLEMFEPSVAVIVTWLDYNLPTSSFVSV